MITDFDLARALFPKPRDIVEQGMGTKSTMRTEHGRATSDSADGIVTVVLDTDVEGPDAEIECPTSYSVSEGDEVLVYISGTTPVDVVVVGGGDAMSGRINGAAQTATNYIVADSSGIKIADSDPANATTFLHLASAFLDFVRGGSSMLKAWLDGAVAKVRVGSESGFNTLTDDEGIKLRSGTTVLSQFATSLIELGKNSSQAVISLLNNNLSISVVDSNPNASGSTPHSYTSTITSGDATIEFAPVSSISGDQSFYDAPAKFSMRSMVSSDPVVYAHGYEHIGHDYVSLQASEEDSDGVPSRLAGFYADVMLGGSVAKVYGDTLWLGDGGGWASTGQDYDMLDVISALDKSIPQGTVVTSNPNAVSVATSSNVTLGSITLAAGTWMVVVSTTFASNSSGRRVVYFADDSSVSSVSVGQMAALTQAPADGGMTKYSSFAIVSPTASTTYYCRAWQNSGSTLSCQCYLRAVRIA